MWRYPVVQFKDLKEISKLMGDVILSTNPIREKIALLTVVSTAIYFETTEGDGGFKALNPSVDHVYAEFHGVERRYKNHQPFKILGVFAGDEKCDIEFVSIKPLLQREE